MGSIDDIARLVDAQGLFVVALLLLARLGPLVWLAPFLGGKLAPASVKTATALTLAVVLLPQVAPTVAGLGQAPPALLVAHVVKEVLVGLSLGFVVALIFFAVQSAGWLADTARGASLAEALVPQLGQRSTPLGSLAFQLTLVLFFAVGGHRIFIAAIGASYQALPVTAFPRVESLGAFGALCIRLSADVVLLSLSLAAPVVAAVLLADLTLGWVNRFAPQVQIFFLAMPLKALLGVAVLAVSMSLLLGALPPLLDGALQQVERAVAILAAPAR